MRTCATWLAVEMKYDEPGGLKRLLLCFTESQCRGFVGVSQRMEVLV